MGCGTLVAHDKDSSLYTEGNFTYYKRAPTLSGPTHFNTTGTFTIHNVPPGATVTAYTYTNAYGTLTTSISGSGSSRTVTVSNPNGNAGFGSLYTAITLNGISVNANTVDFVYGEYVPPVESYHKILPYGYTEYGWCIMGNGINCLRLRTETLWGFTV
jgi:hypothetical protein